MVVLNKNNKKFVTESIFIKEAIKNNLSLDEFLLLLYFDNSFDLEFDISLIAKVLNLDESRVLNAYSSLMKKKLIKVKAEKNGFGKIAEKVSLDDYYKEMTLDAKEDQKEEEKKTIYSIFEEKLGRTLNGMDYEVINAWLDKGFQEELIIAALKEAVDNGANSLRYIDKVLYDWQRKGIKIPEDIQNKKQEIQTTKQELEDRSPLFETSLLNLDWLNEK